MDLDEITFSNENSCSLNNNMLEVTPLFIGEIENKNELTNTFAESLEIFDTDDSDNEDMVLESSLKIYVGQVFQTWIDAETFLNEYALQKGFSFRRKRTEILVEDGIKVVRKISWECSCAGKYYPKKILPPEDQRNRQSKCTNCQWRVNGNLPKKSSHMD